VKALVSVVGGRWWVVKGRMACGHTSDGWLCGLCSQKLECWMHGCMNVWMCGW
jgi:hypothetical protein